MCVCVCLYVCTIDIKIYFCHKMSGSHRFVFKRFHSFLEPTLSTPRGAARGQISMLEKLDNMQKRGVLK